MIRVLAGGLAVFFWAALPFAPAPALGAAPGEAALQADQAFHAAAEEGDRAAAQRLLAPDFTFTNAAGATRSGSASLARLSAFHWAAPAALSVHDYGRLAMVTGADGDLHFAHILTKGPEGWRLYLVLETKVRSGGKAGAAGSEDRYATHPGDCINPCRSVPYTPKTAMDRAIFETWQQTKLEEWHPDAKAWATHIASEFMLVRDAGVLDRQQRVAMADRQQASPVGMPGNPIMSMSIHDFGDNAAVMISQDRRYRGGKPDYTLRIWVLRDGLWQVTLSQASTIAAAAPMPAIAAN